MAKTAKEQLAHYRAKASEVVKANRAKVKGTVHTIEMAAGAFGGGYIRASYPDGIAGVPGDAALALLLTGLGMGMQSKDLTSVGLGLGMGYLSHLGQSMAQEAAVPTMRRVV